MFASKPMMFASKPMFAPRLKLAPLAIALVLLAGCKSRQDAALDQAKAQAAATGQAQQVVSTDTNGTTTTTVVQPPAPGTKTQQITTTTTKSSSVSAAEPTVAPVAGPVAGPAMAQTAPVGGSAPPANQPVVSPVNVNIPAGTTLAIRINQHISVKTSRPGDHFTGEVNDPISIDGRNVLVPRGTHVEGIVDASHRRGHFKGESILQLRLVSMTLNGQSYALDTRDLTRTKKGKGKRSAALIGGGTGLGMLVGGVATGGVGLLVGGAVGGGAGTAVAGLTGNRDIEIPAETVMNFKLADDLVVQP